MALRFFFSLQRSTGTGLRSWSREYEEGGGGGANSSPGVVGAVVTLLLVLLGTRRLGYRELYTEPRLLVLEGGDTERRSLTCDES